MIINMIGWNRWIGHNYTSGFTYKIILVEACKDVVVLVLSLSPRQKGITSPDYTMRFHTYYINITHLYNFQIRFLIILLNSITTNISLTCLNYLLQFRCSFPLQFVFGLLYLFCIEIELFQVGFSTFV